MGHKYDGGVFYNINALKHFGVSEPWIPVMHRVPDLLRKQNEDVYTPVTVSIGPLHRDKTHLQAMEDIKLSYMYFLLDRGITERHKTPFCYNAVHRDLLLLKDQIPFFVLEGLFQKTVKCLQRLPSFPGERSLPIPTLTQCILLFFGNMIALEDTRTTEEEYSFHGSRHPYHIHHLLHMRFTSASTNDEGDGETPLEQRNSKVSGFNYSATKLDVAGVKLKAVAKRALHDLKFSTAPRCFHLRQKGQIEIPPFSINESTEPFLRNLIAFEQRCPQFSSNFLLHAFLMDILIDTIDDVELLEEAGIIHNGLGSREAVLHIFNNICKCVVPHRFKYSGLLMEVKDFCTPARTFYAMFSYHNQ
ncbi:UPF0481 protein At3g47200-like [Cornus florida]|uniref:UPF0481 protein At3g47200-like n=1 Tax=Cornus florida TaxID=4283 RepID=UPI0028A288D5|nr:UPF0481 protein At3g47200-like [Cornus florida]